jgi:hypothetical protein
VRWQLCWSVVLVVGCTARTQCTRRQASKHQMSLTNCSWGVGGGRADNPVPAYSGGLDDCCETDNLNRPLTHFEPLAHTPERTHATHTLAGTHTKSLSHIPLSKTHSHPTLTLACARTHTHARTTARPHTRARARTHAHARKSVLTHLDARHGRRPGPAGGARDVGRAHRRVPGGALHGAGGPPRGPAGGGGGTGGRGGGGGVGRDDERATGVVDQAKG